MKSLSVQVNNSGNTEHTAIPRALKAEFHARLRAWYAKNGRKTLPWRNTVDPYAIYLSEIMLQQTQVATVLERYYFPFLQAFPTLEVLAAAPREAVLKAWQGLGYYNRAVNLHRAAQLCDGLLPANVDALRQLPGIGRNTAHAVAAFAFHQPVAVMEANVKRVLHRIFALPQVDTPQLWELADALLDRQHPFEYNQAMMDIGAYVCTKRAPKCGECPASLICQGKATPEMYPAPKATKQTPIRKKIIYVLRNKEGKYFAEPRQDAFLRGMYRFVEEDVSSSRRKPGSRKLGAITQTYSHFRLEAEVYVAASNKSGKDWFSLVELQNLPHSKAEEKILILLSQWQHAPAYRRAR